MGVGLGLGIASFVLAAGSAVAQQKQQKKAAAEQKKARKENEAATAAQQSMEQAKDDQQRRQQIRERRMKKAMIMQSAENTGAGYASGEIGGVGALSTDYYANMQYINSMGNMRTDAASAQTRANDAWFKATQYQNKASQIGALGGLLQSGLRAGASIYSTSFNGTKDYNNTIDYSGGSSNVQADGDYSWGSGARDQWTGMGSNTRNLWRR